MPVSKWHEVIGEKTVADAILDRIINRKEKKNNESKVTVHLVKKILKEGSVDFSIK